MTRRKLIFCLTAPLTLSCLAGCGSPDPNEERSSSSSFAKLSPADDTPSATIDSPAEGDKLPVGIVRITGHYTHGYNLQVTVSGKVLDRAHVVTNGDESGTWYYDLDTRKFDGQIQVAVSAAGIWSPWRTVSVDNPAANTPSVTITGPADGAAVHDVTPIHVTVDARNDIESVAVRINGGPWLGATKVQDGYELTWDPTALGDTMASIEARAIDRRGNVARSFTTYVRVGNVTAPPVHVAPLDRAMWLWETGSYALVHDPGARRVLEDFARDGKVKTIYFGVARYAGENMLEDMRPRVREFVAWAHAAGLQVYALIASAAQPDFLGAIEPYQGFAIREYEKVLNYNLSSGSREAFDGVNVDLEPYAWPEYDTKAPLIQVEWLNTIEHMIQRRDAAGSGMPFGQAVPFWLGGISVPWKGQTRPLNEHMQDLDDYVAIMSYRDSAAGMLDAAQQELSYAAQVGKLAWVGLESSEIANPSPGDPYWISYHHVGRAYMENELSKLEAAASSKPGYGGIVMEHYDALIDLPSDWSPDATYPPRPADAAPPSAVGSPLSASTFDFQGIDLTWGRAHDDTLVDHYNIYRAAEPNFHPCAENLAGTTRDLQFSDVGLAPTTRYFYRVTAVDISGKEGPASAPASAVTAAPELPLRQMIIDKIELTAGTAKNTAMVRIRVVDKATGQPLSAAVHGHFTKRGGLYLDMTTDPDGWTPATSSEEFTLDQGIVGFTPERVVATGYYWASAYDHVHYTEVNLPSRADAVGRIAAR